MRSPGRPATRPHAVPASVLVARAQAGSTAAFEELVRRYRPRIVALALHLCGTESEADDITQEVFFSAFRNLHTFQGRSEFFTWVYRMAVNRALNARRDRSRRRETTMDDPRVDRAVAVDAAGNPARAAELRQLYGRLIAALDRLPPDMKTSVVLVVLQGLSQAEAAVVQACSPGTVAWRIHEARQRLRRALELPPPPHASRARAARPADRGAGAGLPGRSKEGIGRDEPPQVVGLLTEWLRPIPSPV